MTCCRTFQKSYVKVEKSFDKSSLQNFINTEYSDLFSGHFGFGLWVRNNILHETGTLYKMLFKAGVTQKDDMSSLSIKLFYLYEKTK